VPVRPLDERGGTTNDEPMLNTLEREALTLLLLNPSLAAEHADERLPFRDEAARALAEAWVDVVGTAGGQRPELEPFVAGLDPVTAGLARSLLASAREGQRTADTATDREALRVCLLRLRKEQVLDRLTDLQALISIGAQDPDQADIHDLERQFQVLHLEREQLEQAINPTAVAVGQRRT
jgi:hypothetical protein